jgi:CheY-like chemotaxis protein
VNRSLLTLAFWSCVGLAVGSAWLHFQNGDQEILSAIQIPFMALALGAAGLTVKFGKEGFEISSRSEARATANVRAAEIKRNTPPTSEKEVHELVRKLARTRAALLLWVDDHPENNVEEMLVFIDLGFNVVAVPSTEAAMTILQRGVVDLVLSDMDRDGDSAAGLQLATQMKALSSPIPIMIYRAQQDELSARALSAGARDVVTTPRDLFAAVASALGS